jgi:hypothetical protein
VLTVLEEMKNKEKELFKNAEKKTAVNKDRRSK